MIKVAALQLWHDDKESVEERIAHGERLIDAASDCNLILLPELWYVGVWSYDIYKQYSESIPGAVVERIAAKARQYNTYICAGSIVEKDGDTLHNTAVLLDPHGKVIGTFRKMHLIGAWGSKEPEMMQPGDNLAAVKTELGVIGLTVCYDIRFPELFRKLAVKHGVDIFLHPNAWPISRVEDLQNFCSVRACENQAFLVSADVCGVNRGNHFAGHSGIYDAWGKKLAGAGLYERALKAEIDLADMHQARKLLPLLKDRRLEV